MNIERSREGDLYKTFGLAISKDGELIGKYSNYEIKVEGKLYTKEEAETLLDQAIEEIGNTFLGNNESEDCVISDVNPKGAYVNNQVLAEWTYDNYDYISTDGIYDAMAAKEISNDGVLIKVQAELSCQDYMKIHEFYVRVVRPEYTLEESIYDEIQRAVNENLMQSQVHLPESVTVDNTSYNLEWSKPKADSPIFILLAVAVLGYLIRYELKERKIREEKKRKRKLQIEYPEIVSEFALLLGAGMNIRTVLKEVTKAGEHKEIAQVLQDIENGYSEQQAFYRLADRCDLKCYRRFTSLITQNIMLGGRHLSKMLLKESEKAYDERKNLTIKMGEEAGTKMMIPMFMMLGIVLTVTVMPAFFSMNI